MPKARAAVLCLIFFTARAQSPDANKSGSSSPCMAVKSVGSHGFRNVLLGGVAGALISKEQYQVLKVSGYPARIGQKFHGGDLKTIQASGAKVVILSRNPAPEEIQKSCVSGAAD